MKSPLFITLCVFSCINGMEDMQQITKREPREWDAHAYAQGNFIQEEAALKFLQESGINFKDKNVLDVGCGTGNITAQIAAYAKHVHGIDASENMIEYAKEHYGKITNLSFEHSFAEDFTPQITYDSAISIFCLHWLEDKQTVFENINSSLKMNGEFFGTIFTSSDPAPFGMIVLQELLQKPECNFLHNITITQDGSLNRYVISDEECKNILEKTGFEILTYQKKSFIHTLKNRDELAAFQRPVAMSRPLFKALSETEKEWLFNEYIDLLLTKLQQNENDHYMWPGTTTTVLHARKITDAPSMQEKL